MSRITTDLFDITELMHHGPENIILSAIKIIGAFVILVNISPLLALAAFIVLPFMFAYAYYPNGKMRRAFRQNRVKIAEINGQIEDNLSGIRVVKSFANEEIEKKKFKIGNAGFCLPRRTAIIIWEAFGAGLGAFTTLIQSTSFSPEPSLLQTVRSMSVILSHLCSTSVYLPIPCGH